ncbi:MAG: cysteine desulfurase family protein [Chloroflexota bacterium]
MATQPPVYLDNAATTPLSPQALEAMRPYLEGQSTGFGNASSLHALGQEARRALDAARDRCARVLGCRVGEVVFTSGGTESNNAAIVGAALAGHEKRLTHIVTTAFEHHAVLAAVELAQRLGCTATLVRPGRDGVIDPGAIGAALTPQTGLVSVMLANNEVGTVQPVAAVAALVRAHEAAHRTRIALHTDAVQAAGYLPLDVDTLGVDLLSLSAHKFNGPKGTGLLYIRHNTPFVPTQLGGAQERGRRGGTENTAGIVGMSVALEAADGTREARCAHALALRERLLAGLTERIEGMAVHGSLERRIPANLSVRFEGVEAEPLLMGLDIAGVCASSGAACTAGSIEPSHVLESLGLDARATRSGLRLSLGPQNTEADVDRAVEALAGLVPRLRAVAGKR